jgi:predicted TIM-barrel fold metal-dependent hydrolase
MGISMLIDINASFGGRESIQRFDVESLEKQLERTPISLAFVHSHEGVFDQRSANEHVGGLCADRPRWRPAAVIHPRDTFVWREEVSRSLAAGVRLFRIYPDKSGWPFDSVFGDLIVESMAGTGGALLIDATTPGLSSWVAARAADTGVPLIFTEVRYFPLTELLPLAQRVTNVYIETSRLTSPNGIEHCVAALGAERLLYGSGACRYPAWVAWQTLERARISSGQREAIAWRNAARLLNLDPPAVDVPAPLDTNDVEAIDVHLHDKFPGGPFPPFTVAQYSAELERSRIIAGVSSSATAIFHDLRQGNDENERLVREVEQLKGYVVVDPRYPDDSAQELERLESPDAFVGVKIHCAHAKTPTNSKSLRNLFVQIAQYGKPVLIHPLGDDWPEALVAIAREHPNLPIIAAHAGYGDAPHPTHDAALRVADQSNIVIEFCSTYLASGAIRRGIESVGIDRVLFGSDFPLIALPYMRAAYHDAELSVDEAAAVYVGTALRLFPALEENVPSRLGMFGQVTSTNATSHLGRRSP